MIASHSVKKLAFHSLLRWKTIVLANSQCTYTLCKKKVGRMYVLNLGVKGSMRELLQPFSTELILNPWCGERWLSWKSNGGNVSYCYSYGISIIDLLLIHWRFDRAPTEFFPLWDGTTRQITCISCQCKGQNDCRSNRELMVVRHNCDLSGASLRHGVQTVGHSVANNARRAVGSRVANERTYEVL